MNQSFLDNIGSENSKINNNNQPVTRNDVHKFYLKINFPTEALFFNFFPAHATQFIPSTFLTVFIEKFLLNMS